MTLPITQVVTRPTPFRLQPRLAALLFALAVFSAATLPAATTAWNGPATTNTANNWSASGNWTGGTPTSATDVKFFDAGAIPGTIPNITNINNTVDVNTTNGWLLYGNTNGFHTTLVANGVTLTINSNLDVGTLVVETVARTPYASITGSNGTVIVNSTNSYLAAKQGSIGGSRATLDMTGLGNFQATVKSVHIGTTGVSPNQAPGSTTFETGTILLGRTNVITAVFTPANLNYIGGAAAIELGYNGSSSAGGANFLYLGLTNSINVTSIRVGGTKGTAATMAFNPAFTNLNPVAVFRGPAGGTSRVSYWSAGDMGERGSSSGVVPGTNDFTFGSVDAMVDQLILGQDPVGTDATAITTTSPSTGVLKFNAGIIDVNTLVLGNQQTTNTHAASSAPFVGKLFINGNATLKVNTVLKMGFTTSNTPSALATFGQLNVTNGTVLANLITVGTNVISVNNQVSLNNATLIVSNTLATSTYPLTNYFTVNSLLGLTLTSDGSTKAFLGILTTGGSTNVVRLNATPVFFGSYPAQIALIKYSSLAGSGYNFGLTNIPNWAPGAYLSNNVVNKSVDLVLPSDPRPSTTAPSSYSGNPGDNVIFSVTAGGVTPLNYQWRKNGANISDGATGNGSTNFGTLTATLGITNAQPADSASASGYTVVITNLYGSITSSPAVLTISASAVAPSITGPNSQTVIQGNTATFTATVAGNPVPAVQWQTGGTNIPGATTSTLVVNNVQYPANDQQVYSIIATNTAGSVTNSATLTVIVPPVITSQPANLVVTNTQTASFTVAATGVPSPVYQWKKNGTAISSGLNNTATNATFTIASVAAGDIASYSVTLTNLAGTTNSVSVTLTVNSTMAATALSPSNSATGVFYDTPLSITFSQAPSLRSAGNIKIYAATNSVTPVDTINLSLGNPQQRTFSGDGQSFSYNIVSISGNTATIYPHSSVMNSNQTYYVTVDNGVFTDASGAYFTGITDTNAWRFTTKPTGAANPTNIVVAADGSGDFLTVQGAVNSIASGSTTPRVINIRTGDYNELVNISGKHNVTFRGQTRGSTIVGYANNATFQVANGGSTHARMAFKVSGNDIAIENLTITNRTPVGGSQAEALMVESGARRLVVNNANIASFQDTILVNQNSSEVLFNNSLIQGQFDYIWGGGRCYFTNCEIKTLVGAGGVLNTGNVTASRTDLAGTNGFAFYRCQFTRITNGIINTTLAGANGTAGGNVAYVSCNFSDNYTNPSAAVIASQILWEFGNSNADNTLPRTFGLTVLTEGDYRLTAARSASLWLGGWSPQIAPNILTQPAGSYLAPGGTVSLTVVATGYPEPSYQWLKNGTNVPGATSSALSIPGAAASDSGNYSVIVSNVAGTVTSSTVTVTVNTAPVAGSDAATVQQGQTTTIAVAKLLANDTDADGDTLSITAVSANASLGGSLVTYTAPGSGSSDTITYALSDGRGGTNIGTINVTLTSSGGSFNQLNPPVNNGNGTYTLDYLGIPGFNYALDESPNLVSPYTWYPVLTNTASGTGAISFTVPLSYPSGSFRTRYAP